MLNESVKQSALLAKEFGTYEKYNKEAIFNSKFFIENIDEDVKELVNQYGLRNSQLLTIAPTGSISTMLGISGGIEPIFNISYIRKTTSLHDEDVCYKVYTPIVKEYMQINNIDNEDDLTDKDLDILTTAMNLKAIDRIKMQSTWQKNIDASISSTINLPFDATVEDVYDIYMSAWKNNLKGVTIFRDGCKRSGILINEKPKETIKEEVITKEETINNEISQELQDHEYPVGRMELQSQSEIETNEKFICPECGNEAIVPTGGCGFCFQCGYSKCH
jgi:ribonucleoside-diphosphate reductase alpha chain